MAESSLVIILHLSRMSVSKQSYSSKLCGLELFGVLFLSLVLKKRLFVMYECDVFSASPLIID